MAFISCFEQDFRYNFPEHMSTLKGETPQAWQRMCSYWAKIITTKGENGVHIWPPCDTSYHQLRHFFNDTEMQHKLLGKMQPVMVIIDGYEQKEISFDDL